MRNLGSPFWFLTFFLLGVFIASSRNSALCDGFRDHRGASTLRVNEREAARVREIFQTYLKCGSMIPTIAELDRRGWITKKWTTKEGKVRGGRKFDKNNLYALLNNKTYIGKIEYGG